MLSKFQAIKRVKAHPMEPQSESERVEKLSVQRGYSTALCELTLVDIQVINGKIRTSRACTGSNLPCEFVSRVSLQWRRRDGTHPVVMKANMTRAFAMLE